MLIPEKTITEVVRQIFIPLKRSFLCANVDCSVIYDCTAQHCPACGSKQYISLDKILNKME